MRIGVLGTARIVEIALLQPALAVPGVEVAAVASRDRDRAEAYAAAHGIPKVHAAYEDLIGDDTLDAVYVPVPASLHSSWSIAALEAGRDELCEKPFAANSAAATAMVSCAERTGRLLVEAFHWRYHPVAARMIDLGRRIGRLLDAEARFHASIPEDDIRFRLELAGGSFMDLGCYPVHQLRTVTGEEPAVVAASATVGPFGIDRTMEASLAFPSGLRARVSSSMVDADARGVEGISFRLTGEEGELVVDNPMAPQYGHRIRARLADGTEVDESIESATTYEHQLRAFLRYSAREEAPLTGGADAVANMAVIDAVYEAAGLGARGS